MFFLKELPSRQMVEGYAVAHGVDPNVISARLAAMRHASLLVRRLEGYFTEHGFSQLRFLFLIIIDREPDRDTLTVGEITERLDVAGPVIARTLRSLLDEDLVFLRKDANDGRIKHVGLSITGRAALDRLLPGYMAILADEVGNPL